MYLVFTRMPGVGYCSRFRSLLLRPLLFVWRLLSSINSLCWITQSQQHRPETPTITNTWPGIRVNKLLLALGTSIFWRYFTVYKQPWCLCLVWTSTRVSSKRSAQLWSIWREEVKGTTFLFLFGCFREKGGAHKGFPGRVCTVMDWIDLYLNSIKKNSEAIVAPGVVPPSIGHLWCRDKRSAIMHKNHQAPLIKGLCLCLTRNRSLYWHALVTRLPDFPCHQFLDRNRVTRRWLLFFDQ